MGDKMFSAINKATGEYTLARDANKDEEYVDSLANGQRVFPVQGEVKKFHYRYDKSVPDSKRLTEFCNESETHETIKQLLYNRLKEYNSDIFVRMEFRYRFGRIADIGGYTENEAFAIEIVHQHTNYTDYQEKREEYWDHNINDIWIFTDDIFDFEKGYGRFLPILEDCQNRYGKILYFENNMLRSLVMLRKHSDTYRAYDILPYSVGFNIDALLNLEQKYKTYTIENKYNQYSYINTELENEVNTFKESFKTKTDELQAILNNITDLDEEIEMKREKIRLWKADCALIDSFDEEKGFEFPLREEITCEYIEMCMHPLYKRRVPFLKIFFPYHGWEEYYIKAYHKELKYAFANAKWSDEFKITRLNDSETLENGYKKPINYIIKKRGIHYE